MLAPALTKQKILTIRAMDSSDIPAVRQMAQDIWRKHYTPEIVCSNQVEYMLSRIYSDETILKNIEEKKQSFWLVYLQEKLAGYAASEPRKAGEIFIDKLYVALEFQRHGIGSALLEHIVSQHSPKRLTLRVNRKNFKAINFYFKHGFMIEGLDTLDIGAGYLMDDFLMGKNV